MFARAIATALTLTLLTGFARAQPEAPVPAYLAASPEYAAAQARVSRGKTLVVVGGLLAGTGGLVMLAGHKEQQRCEDSDDSGALFECLGAGAVQVAGGAVAAGGVVMAATGGLVWLHGERSLDDLGSAPVTVTPRPGGATATLSLRF